MRDRDDAPGGLADIVPQSSTLLTVRSPARPKASYAEIAAVSQVGSDWKGR